MKRILLLLVIIVGLIVAGSKLFGSSDGQSTSGYGSVAITYNIADPSTTSTLIDGHTDTASKTTGSVVTYQVAPGSHTLTINALGFKQFKASFDSTVNQPVSITAQLVLSSDSTITSASQIPGLAASGVTISNVQYFYAKTWAVFTVTLPYTDPALAAAKYIPASSQWVLAAGPGTYFDPSTDVEGLPSQVANALLNTQSEQNQGE